jgi:hypothetical protein
MSGIASKEDAALGVRTVLSPFDLHRSSLRVYGGIIYRIARAYPRKHSVNSAFSPDSHTLDHAVLGM